MRADDALWQSDEGLISADTENGLALIYREPPGERVSAEPFHLSFTPRDTDGRLNAVGTVRYGSYGDLAGAVSAAEAVYGVREAVWTPTSAGDLPRGGHGPPPLDE